MILLSYFDQKLSRVALCLICLFLTPGIQSVTNTCTPKKCVQCNQDPNTKNLYCTQCYKSSLGGTATDLKDGFCDGTSSSISNCLVATRSGTTAECVRCDKNYQLTSDGQCTSLTIQNCLIGGLSKSVVTCKACINNTYPALILQNSCISGATVIKNCQAHGDSDKCYLCDNGYTRSKDRKSCIKNGKEEGHTCNYTSGNSGTASGKDICRACNYFNGYVTSQVNTILKYGDNDTQMCDKAEDVTKITVFGASSLIYGYLVLVLIIELLIQF